MKDAKLVELLKTFSKKEFKEFEKFIRSPYFNKGRDLLPFYKVLVSFHPGFDNQNFTTEYIFKKIYPHLKYEPNKSRNILRVLSSEMMQLGKEFIKQEELKTEKGTNHLIELKSLRKRNLDKHYFKLHKRIMDESDTVEMTESNFFLEYHLYHKDLCQMETNLFRDSQDMVSLFNYFLFESGKFISGAEGEIKDFKKNENDNLLFSFFKSVDLNKFLTQLDEGSMSQKNKDLVRYFTYYIMFSLDPLNDQRLAEFEECFFKVRKYIGKDIKFNSYSAINNYYAYNINLPKLNVVYKNLLEDNIFEPNPNYRMPYLTYRGIFRNFLDIGKKDEAINFLERYRSYLSPEFEQPLYDLCIAEIEVYDKKYKKALDHVSKIEISSFFLKYDVRNLLLKIYYSLGHYEEACCLIQSYKKFLKGNKNVLDEIEKRLLKFLGFYEKLFNLKLSNNITEIKKFGKEFESVSQNSIWFKNWITMEINSLLN